MMSDWVSVFTKTSLVADKDSDGAGVGPGVGWGEG